MNAPFPAPLVPGVIPDAAGPGIGTPSGAGAAGAQSAPLYGVVRVGAMLAALPIDAIREVVPHPASLLPFPATMPHLLGAIELRGAIVPVLDLAGLLGGGHATNGSSDGAGIVMLLRVAGQLFGICIQEIHGVVPLPATAQTPISIAGDAHALVLAGFAQGNLHGVLLDVARIAALPGLASARERPVTNDAAAHAGAPTLMFSAGGFRFGLDARMIEASIPVSRIAPSPVDDPLWIGMVTHNGRHIAVVDSLRLLGLGAYEPAAEFASVAVRMPGGRLVALRIDTVENILRITRDDHLPVPPFATSHGHLLAGLHQAEHLSTLINGAALQAEPALCDIAGLEEHAQDENRKSGTSTGALATDAVNNRRPFLIIEVAGGGFAIPLEQVDEILPAQGKDRVNLLPQANGIIGMIAHRGAAIPICALQQQLHIESPAAPDSDGNGAPAAGYILLASKNGHRLGFLLDNLSAVERTVPQTLAHPHGSMANGVRRQDVPNHTIRTSEGRTCTILDLQDIITAIAAPSTIPA